MLTRPPFSFPLSPITLSTLNFQLEVRSGIKSLCCSSDLPGCLRPSVISKNLDGQVHLEDIYLVNLLSSIVSGF